ncbi:MAG: 30S ribosomal protein S9 [Phycisphaerales bacterium]
MSDAPAPVAPAPAPAAPAIMPATAPRKGPDKQGWWWGTGRRKTAVARVRLKAGKGEFKVNGRDLDAYFSEERDRKDVRNVLEKTSTSKGVDVYVNVLGGGYMGQAGAIVLGVGRALKDYDPNLESILRDNGFLTRDDREVERKKPGQKGARARFQFSKR